MRLWHRRFRPLPSSGWPLRKPLRTPNGALLHRFGLIERRSTASWVTPPATARRREVEIVLAMLGTTLTRRSRNCIAESAAAFPLVGILLPTHHQNSLTADCKPVDSSSSRRLPFRQKFRHFLHAYGFCLRANCIKKLRPAIFGCLQSSIPSLKFPEFQKFLASQELASAEACFGARPMSVCSRFIGPAWITNW